MAVTASGMFVANWVDMLDNTQLAINLQSDDIKAAMFTNNITPNFSTDRNYGSAPYNANEVSGTGYTAGGASLASKVVDESPAGTLRFHAGNVSWPGSTISNARCVLLYDSTLSSDPAIVLVNFGADYSTSNGTFTIQWQPVGIFYMDLTP